MFYDTYKGNLLIPAIHRRHSCAMLVFGLGIMRYAAFTTKGSQLVYSKSSYFFLYCSPTIHLAVLVTNIAGIQALLPGYAGNSMRGHK